MVEHGNKYGSDLVLHKSTLFNHCDRKCLHPYFQQNQVAGSKLGVLSVQNISKYRPGYKCPLRIVSEQHLIKFCLQGLNKTEQVDQLFKVIRSPYRSEASQKPKIMSMVCMAIGLLAAGGCVTAGVFHELDLAIGLGVVALLIVLLALVCRCKFRK